MKVAVIHHDKDLDGIMSAAIVSFFFRLLDKIQWRTIEAETELRFFPMDYGKPFSVADLAGFDRVFMVDFSLPLHQMSEIFGIFRDRFVWIDHHAAKFAEVDQAVPGIQGLRINGKAACMLAWEFFAPEKHVTERSPEYLRPLGTLCIDKNPLVPASTPMAITYASMGDTRNPSELPEAVIAFGVGVYSELPVETGDFSCLWKYFSGDHENATSRSIERGFAILDYEKTQNRLYAKKYAFEAKFRTPSGTEYNVIALNKGMAGSPAFEGVFDPAKHDFMVAFAFDGHVWGVSLRSVGNMNVAAIAQQFGGNGHPNAAGFGVKEDIREVIRTVR